MIYVVELREIAKKTTPKPKKQKQKQHAHAVHESQQHHLQRELQDFDNFQSTV